MNEMSYILTILLLVIQITMMILLNNKIIWWLFTNKYFLLFYTISIALLFMMYHNQLYLELSIYSGLYVIVSSYYYITVLKNKRMKK